MLVLKVSEIRWGGSLKSSSTVLSEVRNQLRGRFYRTEVGRDGQAVVVDFADGGGEHPVDVVPAFFVKVEKFPVFCIPDGEGRWIETSPQAHGKYIAQGDASCAGKLKRVAKLIKYWRVCRLAQIPLNSFHLELLLAQEGTCIGVKTYGQCLAQAFQLLASRNCRALQDPIGISGWIKAANTEAKQGQVQAAVQDSAIHALRALVAEQAGQTEEAIHQWDMVFNGKFPAA